jgi:hypothetical protein
MVVVKRKLKLISCLTNSEDRFLETRSAHFTYSSRSPAPAYHTSNIGLSQGAGARICCTEAGSTLELHTINKRVCFPCACCHFILRIFGETDIL